MSRWPDRTASERFWEKVERGSDDECWLWTGGKIPGGYGHFMAKSPKPILAHRFAYIELVGPIPDGLVCDHLCRNPSCVNPTHIDIVTLGENTRRGLAGAKNREKTHCIHGHEFTSENTIVYDWKGRPKRACRSCRQRRAREQNVRQKAQRATRNA